MFEGMSWQTISATTVAFDVLMSLVQVQGQIFVAPPHGVADFATKGTYKLVIVGSPSNSVIVSRIIRFSGRDRVNHSYNKICGYTRDTVIGKPSTDIIIDIFLHWLSRVYPFLRIAFHGTQATWKVLHQIIKVRRVSWSKAHWMYCVRNLYSNRFTKLVNNAGLSRVTALFVSIHSKQKN